MSSCSAAALTTHQQEKTEKINGGELAKV